MGSIAVVVPPSLEGGPVELLVRQLQSFAVDARWATREDVKESVVKVIVTDFDSIVGLEFDAIVIMGVEGTAQAD